MGCQSLNLVAMGVLVAGDGRVPQDQPYDQHVTNIDGDIRYTATGPISVCVDLVSCLDSRPITVCNLAGFSWQESVVDGLGILTV